MGSFCLVVFSSNIKVFMEIGKRRYFIKGVLLSEFLL